MATWGGIRAWTNESYANVSDMERVFGNLEFLMERTKSVTVSAPDKARAVELKSVAINDIMSKYKLIIEYYLKGNNRTQIATLCDCSRMTVWRVLQRVNTIGIGELSGMSEKRTCLFAFSGKGETGRRVSDSRF